MRSLLAIADPQSVVETSTDDVGVELAAVSIVNLSLKGVTETVIGHAFQLGDGAAICFQGGHPIGMAEDLDTLNLDKKLFFLRAPGFCAMFSEFLLKPFIDSFPFFENH